MMPSIAVNSITHAATQHIIAGLARGVAGGGGKFGTKKEIIRKNKVHDRDTKSTRSGYIKDTIGIYKGHDRDT